MAYGIQFKDHPTVQSAAEAAEKRVSTYGQGQSVGVLFRVDAVQYAYRPDPYEDDWATTSPILELTAFAVKKWTKTGATLFLLSGSRPRHVNFSHTKQFACRTVEEALESFRQRRKSQIRRLTAQLAHAERELELVEKAMGLRPDPLHVLVGSPGEVPLPAGFPSPPAKPAASAAPEENAAQP